jgi:hypothetical protein
MTMTATSLTWLAAQVVIGVWIVVAERLGFFRGSCETRRHFEHLSHDI